MAWMCGVNFGASPTYEIGGFYHWVLIWLHGFSHDLPSLFGRVSAQLIGCSTFCHSSAYSYSARPIVDISSLFCNYTTSSCLMQVPQHRRENPLVIWYLCSLYKASHLFHVHLGTFPVDLVPTTLVVLRNTCLIVHENIAVIGYYYTTWRTLKDLDVGA